MSAEEQQNSLHWYEAILYGAKHWPVFWPYLLGIILALGLVFFAFLTLNTKAGQHREMVSREAARRATIVNTAISPQTDDDASSIDVFTDGVVRREGDRNLSIVATISSFAKVGLPDPTKVLSANHVEVLRPLATPFVSGSTRVELHRIVQLDPSTLGPVSASLTVMVRNSDIHSGGEQLAIALRAIESTLSTLVGADIALSVYEIKSDRPSADQFQRIGGNIFWSPEELSQSPLSDFQDYMTQHPGRVPTSSEELRSHVEYVLTRTRVLPAARQRFVLILLPDSELDIELVRNTDMFRFVTLYKGKGNDRNEEFERFGILNFVHAMNELRDGKPGAALRVWAGQFAPGRQARYKIFWDRGSFNTAGRGLFVIHVTYQHLDQPIEGRITVLFDGTTP